MSKLVFAGLLSPFSLLLYDYLNFKYSHILTVFLPIFPSGGHDLTLNFQSWRRSPSLPVLASLPWVLLVLSLSSCSSPSTTFWLEVNKQTVRIKNAVNVIIDFMGVNYLGIEFPRVVLLYDTSLQKLWSSVDENESVGGNDQRRFDFSVETWCWE